MTKSFNYKASGVDIDNADAAKEKMKSSLASSDPRLLNKLGAFASLYHPDLSSYKEPVIVFKTEEPGTKQKLAIQNNNYSSICYDTINHLVNDLICTGAKPLLAQDAIICGILDQKIVNELVSAMSKACAENDCILCGGETSEQPGVIAAGTYILTASMIGVVEKSNIIDGSKIKAGDKLIALESSGIHTNGFSLVRALLHEYPELKNEQVNGKNFIDEILTPHRCYYKYLKTSFGNPSLKGLAHITGGGIVDNLARIIPANCSAIINFDKINVLPIFKMIQSKGNVSEQDMLRTFNLGVGMVVVVSAEFEIEFVKKLMSLGLNVYELGMIIAANDNRKVLIKYS